MSEIYKNLLLLSLFLTGSLFASESTLEFKIVSFGNQEISMKKNMKNKLCLMIDNDPKMAERTETSADDMNSYLLNFQDEKICLVSQLKNESKSVCGYMMCGLHDKLSIQDKNGKNYVSVGYINAIGIDQNYRGRGIAQKFLTKFENHCKDNDMRLMALFVDADNKSAIRAYEKYGFSLQGVDANGMNRMEKILEIRC